MAKAKRLIGSRVSVNNDDIGTVTDVVSVVKNDKTFVVVVTDRNRRIEAQSLLNSLTSASKQKVYPDGTAYSKRFAGPKAAYSASPTLVAQINTNARIGIHQIDITSHLSSHDNCDEDVAKPEGSKNV